MENEDDKTYGVESTTIHRSCPQFKLIKHFCHESKNLYNFANYILRQRMFIYDYSLHNFFKLRNHIRNCDDEGNPWGRQLSTHVGAETLRVLMQNWKSYFALKKLYKKQGSGKKANLPKYLNKQGEFGLYFDSACFIQEDACVRIKCKGLQGFSVPFTKSNKVKQVRILPRDLHFKVEVIYEDELPEQLTDNGQYMSIDLGLNNLATVTSNVRGFQPLIVNGKGLKSVNQWFNKQKAHYQSVYEHFKQAKSSKRLREMPYKRSNFLNDYMHKTATLIVKTASQHNISKIIVGYNEEWKQKINLGTKNNQNFVNIPYAKLVDLITYKAKKLGIEVIKTEESYTSKTSFLDGEFPTKREEYAGRRIKRGLFKTKAGKLINADVNGAYQILKKVFPNAYAEGIEALSLVPVKVNSVRFSC